MIELLALLIVVAVVVAAVVVVRREASERAQAEARAASAERDAEHLRDKIRAKDRGAVELKRREEKALAQALAESQERQLLQRRVAKLEEAGLPEPLSDGPLVVMGADPCSIVRVWRDVGESAELIGCVHEQEADHLGYLELPREQLRQVGVPILDYEAGGIRRRLHVNASVPAVRLPN